MSKVQVDKVVNLSDDGAPQLTYGAELPVGYGLTGAGGLNITGVVTAASAVFSGNVTIGGTLTYEDVTNIDVVGVSTFAGRMNVNSSALFSEGLSVTAGVTTIAGTSTFAKKATVNATLEATEGIDVSAGIATFSGGTVLIESNSGNAAHTHLKLLNNDTTSSGETGQTSDIEFFFTDNTGNSYKGAKISAYKQNDWVGNVDYDAGFAFYTVDNTVSFEDAYSERLRILADGNIGIGTDIPTNPATSANSSVTSAGIVTAYKYYGDGSALTGIDSVGGDNAVSFNDSVKINIGSGTDSSLYHDASNTILQHNSGAAGDVYIRNRSVAGNGNIYFEAGNGSDNQSENSIVCMGTGQRRVKLYFEGSEACKTSSDGLAFPSGKGIDFSADSSTDGSPSTEVLDDYEVGDWTPAVQFNYSGSETVTPTGRYTKIGKMVFVTFRIAIDSNSGGGACKVTGLPYTKENPSGDNNSAVACFIENAISTPDGTPMCIFFDNHDYFEIRIAGETGSGNDGADYMDADTALLSEFWYLTS